MRKIRDVLRLRHTGGLSVRQISRSTKTSVGSIQKLLTTAKSRNSRIRVTVIKYRVYGYRPQLRDHRPSRLRHRLRSEIKLVLYEPVMQVLEDCQTTDAG